MSMEIHKETKGWTTKEVALKLGISESWLRTHARKVGMVRHKSAEGPDQYIWFQEDIEKAISEIPKVIPEAKQELTKRYMNEGIVVQRTTDTSIMKAQLRVIENLILAKEEHELMILNLKKETSAMQLELEDQKETLQSHIDNEPLQDITMKTIRDLIHAVHDINNISIWHELHTEFHFSALGRISEIKGRAVIEYIKGKYFY